MSEADNIAIVKRWFHEVWNDRRDATVRELLDPNAVGHLEGLVTHGIDEFFTARAFILGAFTPFDIHPDEVLAQGDAVVVRWSATGTHGGDALGFPATGKSVSFRGITWLRLSNGRIVEGWDAWNQGRIAAELQGIDLTAARA